MRCRPLVDPATGKAIGIACGPYPKRCRCATCALLGAKLECDGCDNVLCGSCAVSPRDGLDFCPLCFRGAWRHWLQLQPKSGGELTQAQRRAAFRAWARADPETFLGLSAPLTAAAKRP